MVKEKSPAVFVAKNSNGHGPKLNEVRMLSTGIEVILKPVPNAAIVKAQSMIENPIVPQVKIEGKEGTFPNPVDPKYQQDISEANTKRVEAQWDVSVMLGVTLVNGLPDDEEWLPGLKMLARLGHLDIDNYDLNSQLEKEFVYKRYIAMAMPDWILLNTISGLTGEDVEAAQDNFRSN